MEDRPFNLRVAIKPKDLTGLYTEMIRNRIFETTISKVSKKYGYIISYSDLVIKSNIVKQSDIIFDIEFTAKCLIPRVGSVLQGEVTVANHMGLFVDVQNKLKILINKNTITDYEYFDSRYVPKCSRLKPDIQVGSMVDICIRGVRYENNIYKCYGVICS